MKVEKTGDYEGFTLDVKRMYVPFVVKLNCKACGKEIVEPLNKVPIHFDYLSYPTVGEPFEYVVYHGEDCDTENFINLRLDLNLKIVEEE